MHIFHSWQIFSFVILGCEAQPTRIYSRYKWGVPVQGRRLPLSILTRFPSQSLRYDKSRHAQLASKNPCTSSSNLNNNIGHISKVYCVTFQICNSAQVYEKWHFHKIISSNLTTLVVSKSIDWNYPISKQLMASIQFYFSFLISSCHSHYLNFDFILQTSGQWIWKL